MPRATCYECFKPASECVCATVPRIDCRTGVHILQHPRERRHPLGTARIVGLSLARATVDVCDDQLSSKYGFFSRGVPSRTGLLYPHALAQPLEEVPSEERPQHLIVLDGTWPHARSLYRHNPWLAALPHYSLSPTSPSRYRIRRQPAPHCISTLEAVVAALAAIEPDLEGLEALLATFDAMIDRQIFHINTHPNPRRKAPRPAGTPEKTP